MAQGLGAGHGNGQQLDLIARLACPLVGRMLAGVDRNVYAIRSRESLKNAIMVQSGMYEDLETEANGATQKKVDENLNAANCRALEGGYMNTKESTYVRNSSFYLTDAISTESFINETRFLLGP